jgi:hypothetical protein
MSASVTPDGHARRLAELADQAGITTISGGAGPWPVTLDVARAWAATCSTAPGTPPERYAGAPLNAVDLAALNPRHDAAWLHLELPTDQDMARLVGLLADCPPVCPLIMHAGRGYVVAPLVQQWGGGRRAVDIRVDAVPAVVTALRQAVGIVGAPVRRSGPHRTGGGPPSADGHPAQTQTTGHADD